MTRYGANSASSRVMFLSMAERIANVGADVDVIDVEERQLLVTEVDQRLQRRLANSPSRRLFSSVPAISSPASASAGLRVDEILGEVMGDELGIAEPERLYPSIDKLARLAPWICLCRLRAFFCQNGHQTNDSMALWSHNPLTIKPYTPDSFLITS